jgi:hypothetical protein
MHGGSMYDCPFISPKEQTLAYKLAIAKGQITAGNDE